MEIMETLKKAFTYILCLTLLTWAVVPIVSGDSLIEFNASLKPGIVSFSWPEKVVKIRQIPGTTLFRIWTDVENESVVFDFLNASEDVIFIEKVKPVQVQSESLNTPFKWENIVDKGNLLAISTGKETIVAVLDTGIDLENTLFQSMLFVNPGENPDDGLDNDGNGYIDDMSGWDMGNMDNLPMDEHGHGTMVTSILTRISPECTILPIKLNYFGGFEIGTGELAEGIFYAVNSGADVINLSVTVPGGSLAIENAIKTASAAGCIVVGAAGNNGYFVEFPATMDEVVAVGSMYDNDTIAYWFSPQGPEIDIVAPGVAVEVTTLGNTASFASGTSYSAPMISGVVALLRSKFPQAAADYIKTILYDGCRDIGNTGRDDIFGYGVLNGSNLLEAVYQTYQKVGTIKGQIEKQVKISENYYCVLNMAPEQGDTPAQEWIIIGGVLNGMEFSFFYNGNAFIDWETAVTSPVTARADVVTEGDILIPLIPELNMGKLGFAIPGENLWYCYAYTTDTDTSKDIITFVDQGTLIVNNIVSLSVAD